MRARLVLFTTLVSVVSVVLLAPSPARASHHLWTFSQIFSNASGTVQFMQLVTTEDGEDSIVNVPITIGGKTFTFNKNLSSTATGTHKWILIGTTGFASTPGAPTPDFIMPDNFLSTGSGSLNYAFNTDVWNYGALPADGVNALHRDRAGGTLTTGPNTPENFNLQTGSVNVSASVPALPAAGVAVLVGALLLAGSGLVRRTRVKSA
jgi:hypothetical protein